MVKNKNIFDLQDTEFSYLKIISFNTDNSIRNFSSYPLKKNKSLTNLDRFNKTIKKGEKIYLECRTKSLVKTYEFFFCIDKKNYDLIYNDIKNETLFSFLNNKLDKLLKKE